LGPINLLETPFQNLNSIEKQSFYETTRYWSTAKLMSCILKHALHWNATAIIVTHNHPSGYLVLSQNDKRVRRKLSAAVDSLDINPLDHLIVVRSGYFSFSDQGLL